VKRRAFLAASSLAGLSTALGPLAFARRLQVSEELRLSFETIHRWLRADAPQILGALRAPITPQDLSRLEQSAGKLPDDLVALYRWHDGIDPAKIANLFFGLVFEPAKNVVSRLQNRAEPGQALKYADPGIDSSYGLGPTRIPIGNDSARCSLCIDLAPAKDGSRGQVILIDDEYSVALKLCDSVSELVASFARDLEQGKYTLAEDALEDGVQWLSPERSIDPVNWYNSPTWARAHRFR
jgi:cell wall assembly regulator SMI1